MTRPNARCPCSLMLVILSLFLVSAHATACPCDALHTYCDYSPGPCPKANLCHGTNTICSCNDCPGAPRGICQNCTAPPKPKPGCFGDSDCPKNSWCEWIQDSPGPDGANCTTTVPECTSYSVLEPGDDNDCLRSCGAQLDPPGADPPVCLSNYCIFYDRDEYYSPQPPYRINDLLSIAYNCVSGGKQSVPSKGRCSIC